MLRLLRARVELSVILDGDPVPSLVRVSARQPLALVREEGDGRVDRLGHVDDDAHAVFRVDGAEVAVVSVFSAASAALSFDEGGGLRGQDDGFLGRAFEVGFVHVHADDGTYFEFRLEEGKVLTVSGLHHWSLVGSAPIRD